MICGIYTLFSLRNKLTRLFCLGVLLSRFLDVLQDKFGELTKHAALGIIIAGLSASFIAFSPLSYGMDGPSSSEPNSPMSHLRWMDTWEF